MTATRLAGPIATNASLPSRVTRTPTGWMASAFMPWTAKPIFLMTLCVAVWITLTEPPISAVTQSRLPSAVNSAKLGRESTRTLSVISCDSVSMKCAMLVVSEVLTRVLPSGLTPMPSGSTPTGISVTFWPESTSTTVTMLSFSLAI